MRIFALLLVGALSQSVVAATSQSPVYIENNRYKLEVVFIKERKAIAGDGYKFKAKKGTKLVHVIANLKNVSDSVQIFRFYHLLFTYDYAGQKREVSGIVGYSGKMGLRFKIQPGEVIKIHDAYPVPEDVDVVEFKFHKVGSVSINTNQLPKEVKSAIAVEEE